MIGIVSESCLMYLYRQHLSLLCSVGKQPIVAIFSKYKSYKRHSIAKKYTIMTLTVARNDPLTKVMIFLSVSMLLLLGEGFLSSVVKFTLSGDG